MTSLSQALADVAGESRAEGASIGQDLRPLAMSFAGLERKVARMLWQLAAFAPTSPPQIASPLAELIDGMALALAHTSTWFRAGLDGPGPELPAVARPNEWRMPGVLEPMAASFGVDRAELVAEAAVSRSAARRWAPSASLHRACPCAAKRLSAPSRARDGGDAVLRGETGDQTDQESRSAGPRAARSMTARATPSMTAMDMRLPRSSGQPYPHQRAALSRPAIAGLTCTDGTV